MISLFFFITKANYVNTLSALKNLSTFTNCHFIVEYWKNEVIMLLKQENIFIKAEPRIANSCFCLLYKKHVLWFTARNELMQNVSEDLTLLFLPCITASC